MKYTVNGFSQKKAVELGLSAEDLLILRWFVDFQGSDKMLKFSSDDGSYAWVDYKHFLEDMPIVKCNKKNLAAKFQHLTDAGVLKHKSIKQGGTFSTYCFGSAYGELVASNDSSNSGEGISKSGNPVPKLGNPVGCKQETPLPEIGPTKINLLNNQSTKDNRESKETAPDKPAQRSQKFVQPSLEEVKAYCSKRGKGIDPEQWYDHYQSNGWMVGKTHMKDWQAAIRTWERHNSTLNMPPKGNPWGGSGKL